MQVLVTRPDDDATDLIAALRERGVGSLHEPMISIAFEPTDEISFDGVQAVLATSANGVRALAGLGPIPSLPLYAVGDATARTARAAGFSEVQSADGDVQALMALVRERLKPEDGALAHPTGGQLAGNFGPALESAGFEYRRYRLYDAEAARSLSPALVAAMKNGSLDGVTLYSARTAQIFVDLVRKSRLVRACRNLDVYCLSPAVADVAGKLGWRTILTASSPDQESFMALFPNSGPGSESTADPESASAQSNEPVSPSAPAMRQNMPRRSNGFGLFFANLVGFAVIAAATAATAPLWTPYVAKLYPGGGAKKTEQVQLEVLSGRLSALEATGGRTPPPDLQVLDAERKRLQSRLDTTLDRLNSLEESLAAVRQMMTAIASPDSPGGAAGVMQQLSARLDTLESGAAATGNESRQLLESLTGQVAKLETAIGASRSDGGAQSNQALVLSIGQLREAVRSSRPYREELTALNILSTEDPDILAQTAILAARAAQGVPDFQMLRARFDNAAGRIVRATFVPDGDGWIDRTLDRLTSSVRWRRTDSLEGPGVEAIVARAERNLQAADITGAVTELKSLPAKGLAVAQPWIDEAVALIASERALAALQVLAVSRLNPKVR